MDMYCTKMCFYSFVIYVVYSFVIYAVYTHARARATYGGSILESKYVWISCNINKQENRMPLGDKIIFH